MADPTDSRRLALRADFTQRPQGAWWPDSRTLGDELTKLLDMWPSDRGRIARVLYSPPDWDDHPYSVQVPGRRLKTGSFPGDDTRELTLVMHDGQRRFLVVVPPDTSRVAAARVLADMAVEPDTRTP
jgi:hypothetical protein